MAGVMLARRLDQATLQRNADWLAMAVAASLPWSTTATGILVALWLIALAPTLDIASVRRELFSAAGGLPVLLAFAGLVGMAWADVELAERFGGFKSFLRLLTIPLLLAQFRRSDKGMWVLASFAASCTVLLATSFVSLLLLRPEQSGGGVLVKTYIVQSIEFAICAFAAFHLALEVGRNGRRGLAAASAVLGMLFLLNIIFVATGRTALIVVAVLLVLFAIRHFGWKGALATLLAGCALAAVLWASSPYLRERVSATLDEVERYRTEREETSAGFRLEFWKKSVEIIARAPLIGHGTGSITEQFRRLAVGQTGMAAVVTPNPHNQTLTVGIQLGFLGIALLYAMWIAHLALFRGGGTIAWIGLVIVVQNIIGSMFNTHLFDFTEGWIYVFLVGVAGGLARREDGQALPMPIRSASALHI
jgi:O-antigen ligase